MACPPNLTLLEKVTPYSILSSGPQSIWEPESLNWSTNGDVTPASLDHSTEEEEHKQEILGPSEQVNRGSILEHIFFDDTPLGAAYIPRSETLPQGLRHKMERKTDDLGLWAPGDLWQHRAWRKSQVGLSTGWSVFQLRDDDYSWEAAVCGGRSGRSSHPEGLYILSFLYVYW